MKKDCVGQIKGKTFVDGLGPHDAEAAYHEAFRTFDSGATRDLDDDKINPEAALSPLVIERYCEYMREMRLMADGSKRSCDNWQKGIPKESFAESLWRHVLAFWKGHRGWTKLAESTLCAIIFNASGYLHRMLEAERDAPESDRSPCCGQPVRFDTDRADPSLDK